MFARAGEEIKQDHQRGQGEESEPLNPGGAEKGALDQA